MNYTPEDEDPNNVEIAAELVRDGWKSTSNAHRNIARLPEGKTGLEALQICAKEAYERIMALAEQQAADTYRRMYAHERYATRQTLDREMFAAFKLAGGESSF